MLSVGLLLIVGTLGCGGRDATIAEIEKLGGKVEYDYPSLRMPVIAVWFGYADRAGLDEVTDAWLEHLKGLTSLQTLDLRNTQVTDAGVNQLKKALPKVRVSHWPR